jgi:hypothetical protein
MKFEISYFDKIKTLVKRNLKILNVATRTYFYLESFDYQILLFLRKKCLKIVKNYIFLCFKSCCPFMNLAVRKK